MDYRRCPECQTNQLEVHKVYPTKFQGVPVIYRRRICRSCQNRITTYELKVDDLKALFNQLKLEQEDIAIKTRSKIAGWKAWYEKYG
jgi:transcriptional regulator NrdR family protein